MTGSDISALKGSFETRKEIAIAFLFGSHAREVRRRNYRKSAVYFHPKERHPVEYEEKIFYNGEHENMFIN